MSSAEGATPLPAGNIVLVGFMGAGKSAVGRALAQTTGRRLIDTDETVVGEGGPTIDEIFAAEGEAGFRRRERKAVEAAARVKDVVISTGGGAVLDPVNAKTLRRSGVVVYLDVSADELVHRLENDPRERPLLKSIEGAPGPKGLRKRVETLLERRRPVYESVADHVVACDGRAPEAVADEIVRRLHRVRSSVEHVKVALQPSYDVVVGRGMLGRTHELVKLPRAAENAFVVSHPRVRRLWGGDLEASLRAAKLRVTWGTFPAGEERKTLDTAQRLLRAIGRAGLHRGDIVVALGGGVVGDVGAFVASTYARGVAVVQVPTTLLAMVDSAIGGKTGVNLPQGKNLVGTFHQPIGVVADLDVLATLPERELRGGLAEVIKYGFIADPGLLDVTRRRDEIVRREDVLIDVVVRCAKIKADVVAQDERETGLRAILNYGHTLGHAVEALAVAGKGPKLHHGEAIAIGMVYAAHVAELLGTAKRELADEHRRVIEAVGLPTRVEGLRWDEVRDAMKLDKKYSKGLRFVLLEEPGKPVVTRVAQKVLQKAYTEVAG